MRDGGGDPMAQAAVRVSTELLGLLPTLTRSPLQAVARLHTLAGAGASPTRTSVVRATPRAPRGCETSRGLLATPTTAPALVVAAVVHAELAERAPFVSHNGLVARAAERLVLVARGVDAEVAGRARGRPPGAATRSTSRTCAATATAVPPGVHAWLLYAAEAYAKGAEASPLSAADTGRERRTCRRRSGSEDSKRRR